MRRGALYLKETGNLLVLENLAMTSAYARTFVRTVGEVAGWGWGWSDWQFLRRKIKLGNLRFSWREF